MRTGGTAGRPGGETDHEEKSVKRGDGGGSRGSLTVVGTGPGELGQLSRRALEALQQSGVIVGYKTYIELLSGLLENKEVVSTGMTREVERCNLAIDRALEGNKVTLVSSGDPGVYGMAGLALELLEQRGALDDIDLEIVPGITSATAAAACLGAPLMHDFVVISLSDLLTPWAVIEKRLEFAARGDFVVVLYNPASKKRTEQIKTARKIMLEHKSGKTPVGIVRNAAREDEEKVITNLEHLLDNHINMFTTVIIGNSQTRLAGKYMVTPRGYRV